MNTAIMAGSFAPFTLGHYDLVERAARLVDRIVVVVADSSSRSCVLDPVAIRQPIVAMACQPITNCTVLTMTGLLADMVQTIGADVIIRGIRTLIDMEYECHMAHMNRTICGVETLFLPSKPEYQHIRASLVREILSSGGDVRQFVPSIIVAELQGLYEYGT